MHEYSIVQSLVDAVERSAATHAGVVHRIDVKIGDLSGVDCELLTTAFEVFRAGTICEHATMTIDRTPVRWACPKCNAEIPRGEPLRCSACKEPAHLTSGDEIILQRIEMEAV